MLTQDGLILITGATGMVGTAVKRYLSDACPGRVLAPTRKQLDLSDQQQVDGYFQHYRPSYVLMIAAHVGGIGANQADPVGFLIKNARMELNLFEACYQYNCQKNLFLGSSCIYPRACPQPIKEEYLLTGPLEPTNEGYAIAKIMGLKLAQYYYAQYGMLTVCPMPCNIYGTNDYFNLQRSHVLAALVKRFVDAADQGAPQVTLWGTGAPRREFIHVDDVAAAIVLLMERYESPEIINLGTGTDISIFDLAQLIANQVGYSGEIDWDSNKPDGMPRKCMDISKLEALGFRSQVSLAVGIERTIAEYRQLKASGRDR